jgi:hypothetical protein
MPFLGEKVSFRLIKVHPRGQRLGRFPNGPRGIGLSTREVLESPYITEFSKQGRKGSFFSKERNEGRGKRYSCLGRIFLIKESGNGQKRRGKERPKNVISPRTGFSIGPFGSERLGFVSMLK